ncbi:Cubilin like [Pseudolycoriella hygida]|uniref:Cubilin like n=1 Tax=Pseudolycoriella hygida TaxID=35572 RepID=A0A9Q0N2Y1_9DIPT|nr:Cubilin like [Pseudolycoriella hygida]
MYDGYDSNAPIGGLPNTNADKFLSSSNVVLIEVGLEYYTLLLLRLEWNEVSQKRQPTVHETQTTNCTENSIVYVSDGHNINITSPGFPYGYATDLNCMWILKPEEVGRHAVFLFDEIDLEDTVNCLGDYVKIYSSNDLSNYKLLNTTCQVTPNEILQLYGDPYLKIHFVSDYYTNRTGFSGIAKSVCGSPMSGPSGVIKATIGDKNCEWSITVRSGRTIKFEFLDFSIPDPSTTHCSSYVLLKNGESMESPFLGRGKYCGTTVPTVENTFSNRAYVVFKKVFLPDLMASFTLRYEEATYDCGGSVIFNGENSTIIHTPNYPNAPHPHVECVWTVVAPSGELIQVNFIEQFNIKNSKACEEEYVELKDGGTVSGNLIGKFCNQMPQTQYSSSNMLRIKYYTDTTMPMNGFKANISLAKCGGYYRYRSGVIQSSHYPGLGAYEKNSICEYHLKGQPGFVMNLTFVDLHLPNADNCSTTDHVEIYSILYSEEKSSEPTKDEIGKYCGNDHLPPSILTSSNVLVRFVTMNGNNLYRGFRISFSSSVEGCGGEISAETGFITSPGYPIGRAFRQYCAWQVTVPKRRRVKAEIVDFDLGSTPFPQYFIQQSLTFFNDFEFSSRIKRFEANDTTEPVYSSDNKMLIGLSIINNAGHRGFKLQFSSDEPSKCEGNFNNDEGTIETPKNLSTYYCEYRRDPSVPLVAEETNAGTLAFYITESSVTWSSTCTSIYPPPIIVEYLPYMRQPFYTQKCNASSEYHSIASPFQQTKVIANKGSYLQVSRYTISYKVNKCGKLIKDTQEVVIRNPQFPPNYGRVACAWQYSTVENAPITISGNYGNLNCTNEYVDITASPFSSYTKKERFCGQSILSNYTIPRNAESVFIEYHSANYNPNSTFEITIKTNYSVCGGTMLAPIFEFSSPANGSQYPNNIECIWDITTSIGYYIGVSFVNRFFLEDSVNCTNDYVEILDFVGNDWELMGRICGRSAPKPFNSTGTRMRLIFRTNKKFAGEGFTVKWEKYCGGVFYVSKESQTLTSPRYPNKYPRNLQCNYTLIAGKEDFINIDFDEFELEDTSRSCVYDSLKIYKYEKWSRPPNAPILVGAYCWRGSLTHVRLKHKTHLIFSSDSYVEGRGFTSRYYLDNCGGNVTNSSVIEVPRKESGKYADYLTCLWYLKAPANNKIVIRFEYFELEPNDQCKYDSVEVFQGLKTDADQRKAMLCGNLTQHAPVVNIKSHNAIVKFHSDGEFNSGGFSALILFSENCDKTIELNDKSPSYTLNQTSTSYPPHLDCHYVITVPDEYVVQIEFEHFHLAPCHNDTSCTCDYVAILDGSDTFAEAIEKNLCGHSLPQTVTSSGRSLFVRYVTDSVYSSSGFAANIKMEPVACGKTLIQLNSTNGEHTLKWPIDSLSYQTNSQCDWIIEVADMEHVEIHFEKFELEDADSSGQCSKDVLKLTDEDTNLYNSEGLGSQFIFTGENSKVIQPFFYWGRSFPTAPHDYCGSGIPDDFVSNSKRVRVRFRSNESIQKSGFQFIARMSPVCHRNYTSLQGRMFATILEDCETYITVAENNTISLYFGRFNVFPSDYSFRCTNETAPMRIYDYLRNRLLQYVCPDSFPNPIFANTSSLMIKTKRSAKLWTYKKEAYDLIYLATDKGLGCGGQIFNYAGQFSSPMYPANNRNASDCRWDISVPQNLVIAISFAVFDMGSSIHCSDNYFQIIETDYEGKETVARQYCGEDVPSAYKSNRNVLSIRFKKTSNFAGTGWSIRFTAVHPSISSEKNFTRPHSKFCDNFHKPQIITSHGNELFVKLSTDSAFNGKGFSAFYTTKPIQCGGMFKVRSLSFTSPNYPQNYASNLYCEWFLQVEDNHRMSLSFDDFDAEVNCQHDSVKIYDGFDKTDSNLMETLCGNGGVGKIYSSTDNKMLVVMQTDDSMELKGFSAKMKMACGRSILINESGTIEMNSFYDIDSSSCNWTLIAPKPDQHVTLTISTLNVLIYYAEACSVKVLVFDGLNAEAPLIREICVEGHPPPIMSNGNALTLFMVGQFSFRSFKFIASYSTLDNTCGGNFSDLNGQVASPLYPKSYPNNVECVWELSASPGNRLILTVEKMDIEFSENCYEDYLEIRENDVSGKLIGVYCGKDVPSVFPQAERFWLKFRSSSDGVGGGFLAQYAYAKTVEIDGTSGTITSPLYPHAFSQFGNSFFYRITVRHGYYISIVTKEVLLMRDRGVRVRLMIYFFVMKYEAMSGSPSHLKKIFLISQGDP